MKLPKTFFLSILVLLEFNKHSFATQYEHFDHLLAASDHGHDTGVANKEKRCFHPMPQWQMPEYRSNLLGSAYNPNQLQPPLLFSREAALNSCIKCQQTFCKVDQACNFCSRVCRHANERSADDRVLMATRFKDQEQDERATETQERYYTVGAFSQGPRQEILAKMLNIPASVQLDRLIILAKNKSKNKPPAIPHPVVIDTAHVFTPNSGIPSELDLELHKVKMDATEGDISKLTSQLNKELDAAIETKKHMLRDSHLTPQEIDKIIEHVVEQLHKKLPITTSKLQKDIVGSNVEDLTRIAEEDDDLDSFKKKHKKHGSKKHGLFSGRDEVVGDAVETQESNDPESNDGDLLEKTVPEELSHHAEFEDTDESLKNIEIPHNTAQQKSEQTEDNEGLEEGAILGHKKMKNFKIGHFKGGGHNGGYQSGKGYHRNNENEEVQDPQNEQTRSYSSYSDTNTGNIYGPQHVGEYMQYQNGNEGQFSGSNKEYQDAYSESRPEPGPYNKEYQYENGYQQPSEIYEPPINENQEYDHPAEVQHPIHPESNYETDQYEISKPYENPINHQEMNQYYKKPNYQSQSPHGMSSYGAQQPMYHQQIPAKPQKVYQPLYTEASYESPQPKPQPAYQPSHAIYHQPEPDYEQPPSSYQPEEPTYNAESPTHEHKPAKPSGTYTQAAYRSGEESSKNSGETTKKPVEKSSEVKSKEETLKKDKDVPEDPTLKASWFENEYNKLRKWISDNAPQSRTPKPEADDENENDKDAIVDEFTKVIEHDLTDGQELTSSETKSLDKKIAKLVRDNINSNNPSKADIQTEKKLDQLEELVEEEAKEEASKEKVGSALDKLKARFSGTVDEPIPKDRVETLRNKLRSSLESLKKDHETMAAKSIPEKKPLIDLQHIVMDGAGKLAEIMTPKEKSLPKIGQRSSASDSDTNVDSTKDTLAEETVGTFHKKDKKDEDSGEWQIIPNYKHDHYGQHQGYRPHQYSYHNYDDSYRTNEPARKDHQSAQSDQSHKLIQNIDKLLRPTPARSEEEETPFQEMIEDIQENLHLPKLPTLPSLLPTPHPHVPHNPFKSPLNDVPFTPEVEQDVRPLFPEDLPAQPPQFQQRNTPQQFNDMSQFPSPFQPEMSQFQNSPFVGAMPQHPQQQQQQHHVLPPALHPPYDYTKFGRLVPEAVHDLHKRDLSVGNEAKKRMYFVGDGIRLPLHMHRHADGTLHLSVDLQKLCKCNGTSCDHSKTTEAKPEFSKAKAIVGEKPSKALIDEEISMDIGDVPLQMVPPHLDISNDAAEELDDDDEVQRVRRSPRFNYYDAEGNLATGQPAHDDETHDHISPIREGLLEQVEKKMDGFNNDMKEYYDNEAVIKQARSDNENVSGYLEKRVTLLGRIINWMKDLAFEE